MIDFVQWPAMVLSVLAAWYVASTNPDRRAKGFWIFVASNVAWIVWGWPQHAYALIVLQVILFLLNVRGLKKNDAV